MKYTSKKLYQSMKKLERKHVYHKVNAVARYNSITTYQFFFFCFMKRSKNVLDLT